MQKIYLTIVAAFASMMVQAAITMPLHQSATPTLPLHTNVAPAHPLSGLVPDECITGQTPTDGLIHHTLCNESPRQLRAEAEADWTEWEQIGTSRFPENFMQYYNQVMPVHAVEVLEWDGSFTLMRRDNKANSDQAQLCLKKVFNGVDIILDYTPSTNGIVCPLQSTGLVPVDVWEYDTFMLQCSSDASHFFSESGTLTLGNIWLLVAPGFGLSMGTANMQLDGTAPTTFSIQAPIFSPSSQPAVTVSVQRSSHVKSYRVIVFPFDESPYMSIINDIMQQQPTGDKEYHTYTSDTFEVPLDMPWRYYVVAIPFDESGKCIGNYTMTTVYSNRQQNYTWTPLGTATMTDILGHIALPDELVIDNEGNMILPAQTREVEIDVRTDNPNMFRIRNPFGTAYPLYDKLNHTDESDNFYMFVDASDPSKAMVTTSLTGFNSQYSITPYMAYSMAYEIQTQNGVVSPELWGKYSDKRIAFPLNSVLVQNMHVTGDSPSGDLEILLPGYEAFPLSWETPDWTSDFTIQLNVGNQKITTIDCALILSDISNENQYFPEVIYDMIANKADGLKIVTYTVSDGKVTINDEDVRNGYGAFRLYVIQREADGTRHDGLRGPFISYRHPDDQWDYIGVATIEENIALLPYAMPDMNTGYCHLYQNQTQPGLYRLIDAYQSIANQFEGTAYNDTDIYLDASNPDRVNFVTDYTKSLPETQFGVPTGFIPNTSIGEFYINTLGNYRMLQNPDSELEDGYYGTLYNGTIEFNGIHLLSGIPSYGYLNNSEDCFFRVIHPALSAIETIECNDTDTDAPVEYFNLQGIRVANPSGGIFIERRGNTVTKRHIP